MNLCDLYFRSLYSPITIDLSVSEDVQQGPDYQSVDPCWKHGAGPEGWDLMKAIFKAGIFWFVDLQLLFPPSLPENLGMPFQRIS